MTAMPATEPLPFASTITFDERRAGFVAIGTSTPPYVAIVRAIDPQRTAVKTMSPTRAISYAIVDRDTLQRLDVCSTLAELLQRYPNN